MILFAGIALAIVLLALFRKGASNEEIVSRLSKQTDPRVVAIAAKLLSERGMRLTAEVLEARAKRLAAGNNAVSGDEGASTLRSPFLAASDGAWTNFVRLLVQSDPHARSSRGRLGRFDIHLRRLEEIGWVTGVRFNEEGVAQAKWVPPMSEERFLADAWAQYRALVATLKLCRRQLVGCGVDAATGAPVKDSGPTLSGVLAVAHRLGAEGAVKWLRSPLERARQPVATALFRSANGLF
ncbi:MAG: hypothetical protein SF187_23615 [Deltaproteobacteria bacterium]|nr:hypothetical protein [Deltaproteobacteria bacterium]